MHEALLKLGLESSRVSIGAPDRQPAKDKLVGSKMSLRAGKQPAAESVPPAEPVPAAVAP
jgi:hypothetical protein